MGHDVFLMVGVGAGLLALGGLARGLPGGGFALAVSPNRLATWPQGMFLPRLALDTHDTMASLSVAEGGVVWSPYRLEPPRVVALRACVTQDRGPDGASLGLARSV